MLAIWVAGDFMAWRSTQPAGRVVVDMTPCWCCGKEEIHIFSVGRDGAVHNEHYNEREDDARL